jgi:hypothetical protein
VSNDARGGGAAIAKERRSLIVSTSMWKLLDLFDGQGSSGTAWPSDRAGSMDREAAAQSLAVLK